MISLTKISKRVGKALKRLSRLKPWKSQTSDAASTLAVYTPDDTTSDSQTTDATSMLTTFSDDVSSVWTSSSIDEQVPPQRDSAQDLKRRRRDVLVLPEDMARRYSTCDTGLVLWYPKLSPMGLPRLNSITSSLDAKVLHANQNEPADLLDGTFLQLAFTAEPEVPYPSNSCSEVTPTNVCSAESDLVPTAPPTPSIGPAKALPTMTQSLSSALHFTPRMDFGPFTPRPSSSPSTPLHTSFEGGRGFPNGSTLNASEGTVLSPISVSDLHSPTSRSLASPDNGEELDSSSHTQSSTSTSEFISSDCPRSSSVTADCEEPTLLYATSAYGAVAAMNSYQTICKGPYLVPSHHALRMQGDTMKQLEYLGVSDVQMVQRILRVVGKGDGTANDAPV